MEIWQVIVVPLVTALLVAFTRPLELVVARRRTGAINGTLVITEFLIRSRMKLHDDHPLKNEIDRHLEYPNALGSEAASGVLLAKIFVELNPSQHERSRIESALNSLDQRASERERAKSSASK